MSLDRSCIVYTSNGTQLAPPPDSTPSNPDQYGGVAGGGSYGGQKEHCIDVDWPSSYTWSARQYRRGYSGPDSWMGSLIFESRDASGLYYRRNRYYDSEKGRFTQEDPIGLAGGVNLYGFAGGDPTSYSDPFGLCPWYIPPGSAACILWDAYTANGVRGVVNEVVGFTPVAGEVNDLVVATTGRNVITRKSVGRGGRALAAIAIAVPIASSSALRALVREGVADVGLWKQLASAEALDEAMQGIGQVIAGAGGRKQIDEIARLVAEYGGQPGDWAKMTTRARSAEDGTSIAVHWYENRVTGQRVEFKTKYREQ